MASEAPFQDLEFSISFGQTLNLDLSQARFRGYMIVDNPGSYWLHFTDLTGVAAWVPPTVLAWSSELPFNRPANLRVTTIDVPSGYSADTSNQTVNANISVRSRPPLYSPGAPQIQKTTVATTFLPVNIALAGTLVGVPTLPANAISGVQSLPITQGMRKSTYTVEADAITTGALVAATDKALLSFEHSAAAIRTTRLQRLVLSAVITTAGAAAGGIKFRLFTGTAASTAGTAVTPRKNNQGQGGAEVVCSTLPTIVAATGPKCVHGTWAPAAAGPLSNPDEIVIYQRVPGDTEELTLRPGFLESIVLLVQAVSTPTLTVYATADLTEE